ncbi:MAG: hypothetical protein ACOC1O_01910 [bacterium]
MDLRFEEGDNVMITANIDSVNKGEIVKIKKVDYADPFLPYLVISTNTKNDAWVTESNLKVFKNSIKKI